MPRLARIFILIALLSGHAHSEDYVTQKLTITIEGLADELTVQDVSVNLETEGAPPPPPPPPPPGPVELTWTTRTGATGASLHAIAWSDDRAEFCATPWRASQAEISADGVSWSAVSTPYGEWRAVTAVRGHPRFASVSHAGSSNDAMVYTGGAFIGKPAASSQDWRGICDIPDGPSGARLFSVAEEGSSPRGQVSDDLGETYQPRDMPKPYQWLTCDYSTTQQRLIAAAEDGVTDGMAKSDDKGETFQLITGLPPRTWQVIKRIEALNLWAAAGGPYIATSPSGDSGTWTEYEPFTGERYMDMEWGDELGKLMLVSINGGVVTTPNLVDFLLDPNAPSGSHEGVAYAPPYKRFAIVNREGGIATAEE